MFQKLWNDECGGLLSAEFVLIATLMICATAVGWSAVNVAIVTELADIGGAIAGLDQTFAVGGFIGHHASCSGQGHQDLLDSCDDAGCVQNGPNSRCLQVCVPKDLGEL